jgi:hypothetical protein
MEILANMSRIPIPEKKAGKIYWGIIPVKNTCDPEKAFVMEFYDQSIDHLEVYFSDKDGAYKLHLTGDRKPFSFKDVEHKNFVFRLPAQRNKPYNIYIKAESENHFAPISSIKEDLDFAEYAMQEYYYFGILYGLVLAMAFYNPKFVNRKSTARRNLFNLKYFLEFIRQNGSNHFFLINSCGNT